MLSTVIALIRPLKIMLVTQVIIERSRTMIVYLLFDGLTTKRKHQCLWARSLYFLTYEQFQLIDDTYRVVTASEETRVS